MPSQLVPYLANYWGLLHNISDHINSTSNNYSQTKFYPNSRHPVVHHQSLHQHRRARNEATQNARQAEIKGSPLSESNESFDLFRITDLCKNIDVH